MKLAIYEHRLARIKAEKYVLGLCKVLNIDVRSTKIINLQHEINFAIQNGKADVLQSIFDATDPLLNTPMTIGLGGNVPGLKIEIESSYGQHKSTIKSHGFIEAPEISFSNEISYYREEAVICFNKNDYVNFARCYRAFLLSSVSLVECFIHRHVFHLKQILPSMAGYKNIEILDSRKSIEDKLDAWIQTYAIQHSKNFLNSKSRSKFIELKKQRNSIVHPAKPTVAYEVKSVVKYLNYVQEGVGGLLSDLRIYAGHSENIGFIRQMKTEPEIRIVKMP